MELHIDELAFQLHTVHLMATTAKIIEHIAISPDASHGTEQNQMYNNNNQKFHFQSDWALECCFKDNCVVWISYWSKEKKRKGKEKVTR